MWVHELMSRDQLTLVICCILGILLPQQYRDPFSGLRWTNEYSVMSGDPRGLHNALWGWNLIDPCRIDTPKITKIYPWSRTFPCEPSAMISEHLENRAPSICNQQDGYSSLLAALWEYPGIQFSAHFTGVWRIPSIEDHIQPQSPY